MAKKPVTKNKNSVKKKKEESDEYKKYKSYLRSKEWKAVQEWFYSHVYEKKCYACGRHEGEDGCTISLHHNDYQHLYDEINHPDCLVPLCSGCHLVIHRKRNNWNRFKMKDEDKKSEKEEKKSEKCRKSSKKLEKSKI